MVTLLARGTSAVVGLMAAAVKQNGSHHFLCFSAMITSPGTADRKGRLRFCAVVKLLLGQQTRRDILTLSKC